jgi:hypothetical protein
MRDHDFLFVEKSPWNGRFSLHKRDDRHGQVFLPRNIRVVNGLSASLETSMITLSPV